MLPKLLANEAIPGGNGETHSNRDYYNDSYGYGHYSSGYSSSPYHQSGNLGANAEGWGEYGY